MNHSACNNSDLTGKIAVMIGTDLRSEGVGISGAPARVMAARGAHVIVSDINEAEAKALADEIISCGFEASATHVDLGDPISIESLFQYVAVTHGSLDILHNNATVVLDNDTTLLDLDLDVWDAVMEINIRGLTLASKHAINLMLLTGGGAIVNTLFGPAPVSDFTRVACGTSKAAIIELTKYIAAQYGAKGIRCNAICQDLTINSEAKSIIQDGDIDISTKYTLTAKQLAETIAFLASPAANFMNGEIIVVDGRLLSHQPVIPGFLQIIDTIETQNKKNKT